MFQTFIPNTVFDRQMSFLTFCSNCNSIAVNKKTVNNSRVHPALFSDTWTEGPYFRYYKTWEVVQVKLISTEYNSMNARNSSSLDMIFQIDKSCFFNYQCRRLFPYIFKYIFLLGVC